MFPGDGRHYSVLRKDHVMVKSSLPDLIYPDWHGVFDSNLVVTEFLKCKGGLLSCGVYC